MLVANLPQAALYGMKKKHLSSMKGLLIMQQLFPVF